MACDMIESSIQRWSFIQNDNFYIMYAIFRTYASFENKLKSGINLNPTDYILPNEVRDIFVPDTDASNSKKCAYLVFTFEKINYFVRTRFAP